MKIFAITIACATVMSALALASPAGAADPVSFSCTANAATASVAGASTINPITAGGPEKACQHDIAGLPNTGEAVTLEEILQAKTAYAAVDPGGFPPIKSKPTAAAGIEDLMITIGGPVLGASAARSSIEATCAKGAPEFKTFSEVANISIGGFPLVLDGVVQPITDPLTDALGALVSIRLNETVDLPNGGKAVRAAHIKLLALDGSTPPLADVIIAESILDLNGKACDPNQPPNNGDDTPPPTTPSVCPNGSVYDVVHNVCVIAVPGSQTPGNPAGDITGPGSVVVGPPNKGPGGGTVITLQQARKRFPKSPCVKGGGPRYVVIGTPGKDRLTGTNRRDRMLGFGGADRLDGGRKKDCIEGGNGKDGMTGGQQNDRVFGGKGRDFLNGDAGNDLLVGGKGRDYINSAYGKDVVSGGKGNDKMNVATAGKKAIVIGGRGFDKVRCNPGDLKGVRKDVERVIVTRKVRG
jgi:hypothetical protein